MKCQYAFPGTYGHECGSPATSILITGCRTAFLQSRDRRCAALSMPGAQSILFRVLESFSPESEPTEDDLLIMQGVHDELQAFFKAGIGWLRMNLTPEQQKAIAEHGADFKITKPEPPRFTSAYAVVFEVNMAQDKAARIARLPVCTECGLHRYALMFREYEAGTDLMSPKPFEGPRALDMLTDFRKRFVALAERRTVELQAFIDEHRGEGPSDKMRDAYDEYDSIRYFEQDLNRVIQAFIAEAVQPWQEAFTAAAMLTCTPLTMSYLQASDSKASGTHAAAGKPKDESL